jgi:dolichyl-phosphate beta-glucosyltransferase
VGRHEAIYQAMRRHVEDKAGREHIMWSAGDDPIGADPNQGSLTLVVPLFNEAHRFQIYAPELLAFISRYPPGSEVVFVDDGSSDGTMQMVKEFVAAHRDSPLRFLQLSHRGKGAAVAAGLMSARTAVAGFCDLDLSTPLDDLARIVDSATDKPIMAIGSRGVATARIVRHQRRTREMLGRAYNKAIQFSVLPGIVDTQCGAKAAPASVWAKIIPLCREVGFAWDVEIIAFARALGFQVREIGVEWHHRQGSRVKPLRDGSRMLRAIPRIRLNLREHLRSTAAFTNEGGEAFDSETAKLLTSNDTSHWWFRSKATFVSLLIRRFAPTDGWLVDIGAGPGGVTAMLGWAPERSIALERNTQLVRETKRRNAVQGVVGDAAQLPIADATANVVCLLDVIEHLTDPTSALREAARVLSADGRLIINVPAHPGLWSSADVVLGHARRYTRRSLRGELEESGCRVVWSSHVFSWLFAPVWLRRRTRPSSEPQLGLDVASPWIDRFAMLLTRLEWAVVSRIPLSFGTSLLCVATRADNVDTFVAQRVEASLQDSAKQESWSS